MADAEVAVDGDCDHDQRREGNVEGDEEEVELADEVDVRSEVHVLHVGRVRHDDQAGGEVHLGKDEDEEGGHEGVLLPGEHVQDEQVAD